MDKHVGKSLMSIIKYGRGFRMLWVSFTSVVNGIPLMVFSTMRPLARNSFLVALPKKNWNWFSIWSFSKNNYPKQTQKSAQTWFARQIQRERERERKIADLSLSACHNL